MALAALFRSNPAKSHAAFVSCAALVPTAVQLAVRNPCSLKSSAENV
jgi:hypothetical protein